MKTAMFGGGCFWCTEAVFKMLKGVTEVEPGYAGGSTGAPHVAPTYEEVSSGNTGHAEVIRITYDPSIISYRDLLTVFFGSHDPTTPNRQGADVGSQYRSIIFYSDDAEKNEAEAYIEEVNASLARGRGEAQGTRVVTELVPAGVFYPAEDYHHDYYARNTNAPYCELVIEPKLEAVRTRLAQLFAK